MSYELTNVKDRVIKPEEYNKLYILEAMNKALNSFSGQRAYSKTKEYIHDFDRAVGDGLGTVIGTGTGVASSHLFDSPNDTVTKKVIKRGIGGLIGAIAGSVIGKSVGPTIGKQPIINKLYEKLANTWKTKLLVDRDMSARTISMLDQASKLDLDSKALEHYLQGIQQYKHTTNKIGE